jgi:two-component system response regulator DctR
MSAVSSREWSVLVVEDDDAVAKVHCRFLSQQPRFKVVGRASTGGQARQLVTTLRPDLVLLDLGLPGRNGLDLLRDLRTHQHAVEVIVVTAHAAPAVVRASMQLGAVDYLVKPFWPRRLSDGLAVFLARMELLQQGSPMDQDTIDRLQRGADPEAVASGEPSSVRRERLAGVRRLLETRSPLTADDVAADMGMARVTARRYLEDMVARGQCTVDTYPDGPGRPRKSYRLWLSDPVGSEALGS